MSIEFQIYDYIEDHEILEEEESDSDSDSNNSYFIIHIFGRCDDNKSVYCKLINFTPYFYILLPEHIQNRSINELEYTVKKIEIFLKGFNKYIYKQSLKEVQLIQLKNADGFTNDKLFWFARLIFTNADGMKKYKNYFENNEVIIYGIPLLPKPVKYKLYEANLPAMLRCFHIRNISGCSWVETSKYKKVTEYKNSRCDIEIIVDWRHLNPINKDHNAPLRIASFDIECNSIDGEFPQANRIGDSIIQIGITYTYLGQSTPYRQYICCLKDTKKFDDNTIVESFEDEKDMLLKCLNEINENDCDILTGYNIFFFDEKYMYDRACKVLNIKDNMSYMSKLISYKCNFKEMKLASSALGENLLRFWDTPGRIHIDLMKYVQKTFNLPSYKLDFVASKFIRGEILSFKIIDSKVPLLIEPLEKSKATLEKQCFSIELKCKSLDDILVGDYIHLEVVKGFMTDEVGDKYIVKSVDYKNKILVIESDNTLIDNLKSIETINNNIFWSQAKDDVGPKDIFRLQKGTSEDRSIVAKYCIKDCKLVSLLINKLEVITNNIEMANVCFVPLSYLFIRGQGIKIFSLCLRAFRKYKYAFPVIKMDKLYCCSGCNAEYLNKWECPKCKSKNRKEIESESSSYEGAIVFSPIAQVDYEAVATKDFSSLYPSADIQKNMSHETKVHNSEYDNIEGVYYYNAEFKEADGTIKTIRYAKKNNTLGVIPSILDDLLMERKSIKKQMKSEKDPFKYKILDAKQLAVKITANSLYGQLGAQTSQICNRDIAACITSTGREMLSFAKKYDEETLPYVINTFKYYHNNNDNHNLELLIKNELKNNNNSNIDDIKNFVTKDIHNLIFQPVIRYGDSVIGKTPLMLKDNRTDEIYFDYIENIVKSTDYKCMVNSDKEYCDLNNYLIWTENGWTNINRVIRHKLHNKKLFTIRTNHGEVTVTEDHSLLDSDGKMVSPKELHVGSKLLHSFPNNNNSDDDDNYYETVICSDALNALEYYYHFTRTIKSNLIVIFEDNVYYMTPSNKPIDNRIISIECYHQYEEYVYDLTTENHHFHAGVGELIVHNTDSIFSCYRFRENAKLVDNDDSIEILKNVLLFASDLISPLLNDNDKNLFLKIFNKYYNKKTIISLYLPKSPKCKPLSDNNKILLDIEDRMEQFVKEYMDDNYIPWLWTLAELVEKNNTDMFIHKLYKWAEYLLYKHHIIMENLYDRRKNEFKPFVNLMGNIFTFDYIEPTDSIINSIINKLDKKNMDSFDFAKDINIPKQELFKITKHFITKNFKEKWTFSSHKKELVKIINNFTSEFKLNNDNNYIHTLILNNTSVDVICNEIIERNPDIDINLLNESLKKIIDEYKKNVGKKSLEDLCNDFIENYLLLSYDKLKQEHENKIINFVRNHLCYHDMSDIDKPNEYIYYYLQPRLVIVNNNYNKYIDVYEGGKSITDHRTLDYSMKMGKISGELIKMTLPFPHSLEYEKTFWPFAILTKKRYVGNKYEMDPNKYKQDFMGIVLKRRDNAIIVKEICSGIIDYLINKRDPKGAKAYTARCIQDMFDGKYDVKYFLQSRTLKLKESYKDWTRIAHVYLSEKIIKRDPGNTPQSGDRIEYAVVKVDNPNGAKLLQGDIIETPKFIKENNLKIDYLFYLTNQIMNPALQFLELVDKNAIDIFNYYINMYSEKNAKSIEKEKEKESKRQEKENNKIISKINSIIKIIEKSNNFKNILLIKNKIDELLDFSKEKSKAESKDNVF
jgi:DNA polymerase elongation subunit (family B)